MNQDVSSLQKQSADPAHSHLEEIYSQLAIKDLTLKRTNKELKALNFVLSHDLQEPLRKIRNFLSLALDGKEELEPVSRTYLEKSYATAWHMQELLEDLLTYFKIKDSNDKPERADLKAIIGAVMQECEDRFREQKAKIDYYGAGELEVSPTQFKQLFHNLVSNSLKFAKKGRTPLIQVKKEIVQGDSKANKRLRRRRQYHHIIYTDNGTGFDPQYNTRVFGLFQRLHSKNEHGGTGIGLAICKRIVENHNGIIVADGRLNQGVRFDIYIPIDNETLKKK